MSTFVRECGVTCHSDILLILTNKGDKVSAGFSLCSSSEGHIFLTYLRVFCLWCSGATFTAVCGLHAFKHVLKTLLSKKRSNHPSPETFRPRIANYRNVNTASSTSCFPPVISKYYLQLKGENVVCFTHS